LRVNAGMVRMGKLLWGLLEVRVGSPAVAGRISWRTSPADCRSFDDLGGVDLHGAEEWNDQRSIGTSEREHPDSIADHGPAIGEVEVLVAAGIGDRRRMAVDRGLRHQVRTRVAGIEDCIRREA